MALKEDLMNQNIELLRQNENIRINNPKKYLTDKTYLANQDMILHNIDRFVDNYSLSTDTLEQKQNMAKKFDNEVLNNYLSSYPTKNKGNKIKNSINDILKYIKNKNDNYNKNNLINKLYEAKDLMNSGLTGDYYNNILPGVGKQRDIVYTNKKKIDDLQNKLKSVDNVAAIQFANDLINDYQSYINYIQDTHSNLRLDGRSPAARSINKYRDEIKKQQDFINKNNTSNNYDNNLKNDNRIIF